MMMKALVLQRTGPNAYRDGCAVVTDRAVPQPGSGEIRVAVRAVGLNPVDYKLAELPWGVSSWTAGDHVLGLDVAGVVDAIGPEVVTDLKIGQRVFFHADLRRPGGLAQFVLTVAHTVAPIPDEISFEQAAALPCAGFTAYQALIRKLAIAKPNRRSLLITGGAGGVGSFAIQITRALGSPQLRDNIIVTCSSRNADLVRKLGATHVIDYNTTHDIVGRVKELTGGRGVDAILDTVSSQSATNLLPALAHNGAIACIAGVANSGSSNFAAFNALDILDIALGAAYASGDIIAQQDLAMMGRELAALVVEGKVIVEPLTVLDKLEDVPEKGWHQLAQRHTTGKIVVKLE